MTRIRWLPAAIFLLWVWSGVCSAAEPVVQKRFEAERTIEYAISMTDGDTVHRLQAIQNKADGAIWIKYTPPQPIGRFEQVAPFLGRLIQAADTLNPGRITSMTAFEYFDCAEMILDAAVAFRDDGPWQQFLKNKTGGADPPSYAAIADRLRQAKVFRAVMSLCQSIGYCAQLSGFEKLAIRSIGPVIDPKRLADRGLAPDPEIPVPLMLQFRLTPMGAAPPCAGESGNGK